MSEKDTVLVTGASEFVAMHCVLCLLKQGYKVRGAVRTKEKGELVQKVSAPHGSKEELQMFLADLRRDEGWMDAVQGCRFVLHVASP